MRKDTAKPSLRKKGSDHMLIIMVAVLTIFGTVMIFSASYYYAINNFGSPYHYLIRQLIWLTGGIVIMWFFSVVDYHIWSRLWLVAYAAGLVLLLMVMIPGIGRTAYGATRWIELGPITIMPGELSKVAIIFFITGYFTKYPQWGSDLKKGIIPIVGLAGAYAGLILAQPNMSTAVTVCLIAGGMLLVVGMKLIHMVGLSAMAVAAGAFLIFRDPTGYKYARFMSFRDPFNDPLDSGWNVVQSLLALGTGGITGLGLGNSVQKTLYLPMPQNDFILAIIGEELGFFGILFLVLAYLVLIWRGWKIAMNAKDYTGMLLASGITMMVGIQVIINFAVVTSSMPPTGVILPFISYGGNALWIFMAMMGILLNISKSAELH